MKLIRTSQSCDVEVEIHPKADGLSYGYGYTVRTIEEGNVQKVWANNASAVDTYKTLAELYENSEIRLPAKFVIEFANYALTELTSHLSVKSITGCSTTDADVVYTAEVTE